MAVYHGFKVLAKATVERYGGAMLLGKSEGFREAAQWTLISVVQKDSRGPLALDHDFCAGTDTGYQRGEVASGFGFRNVDGSHVLMTARIQIFS